MKAILSKVISWLHLDTQKEIFLYKLGLRKKIYSAKEEVVISLYSQYISSGMLVFDIGANVGHYTAGFIKMGAKVICVEPQEDCFKVLKARYARNDRVKLLNCALDSAAGEKKMLISNQHVISSMSPDWVKAVKESNRFPGAQWHKEAVIKTNTLDNLILDYGTPDFIKIDVEGYELNVLKGLTRKVPLISIEYTPEIIENTIKCIEYLLGIGTLTIAFDAISNNAAWISGENCIEVLKQIKIDNVSFGDIYVKFI